MPDPTPPPDWMMRNWGKPILKSDPTPKLTAKQKIDAALSRIEVLVSSIAKQQAARLELAEFARLRALAKEQGKA